MNYLTKYLADAHIEDLRRDARRTKPPLLAVGREEGDARHNPITIRRAGPGDAPELKRVAGLDSSNVPAAPMLLADVRGEVRAAVSLADGTVIADPFHGTGAIIELIEAWAAHELKDRPAGLRRRLRRAVRRGRRRTLATGQGEPLRDVR
jgi:hypothetical protein